MHLNLRHLVVVQANEQINHASQSKASLNQNLQSDTSIPHLLSGSALSRHPPFDESTLKQVESPLVVPP